jgi:archaellin
MGAPGMPGPGFPGPGFPGPGMPPPPPRKSNGPLIAVIVAGAVAVVVLLVVVVFVVALSGKTPEERLAAAANSLSTARSVKLKGDFSYASDNLQGEVTVTRGGHTTGTVNWNGDNVSLLATDEKVFVKAPKSYWTGKLSSLSSNSFLKEGDQWGLVGSSELSLRFDRDLTPSALVSRLRQVSRYNITETETTVQGQKAYRIRSSLYTVYISENDELLRYESTVSPRVRADVEPQSSSDTTATLTQMRSTIDQLADAFDSSRPPRNSAKPEFVSCSRGGQPCTVRVRVWATRGGAPSVTIKVNFRLTSQSGGSGTFYGECSDTGVVTGVSDVTVSCTISGGEGARSGKNARRVWVQATPMAMAVSPSEISSMKSALSSE